VRVAAIQSHGKDEDELPSIKERLNNFYLLYNTLGVKMSCLKGDI
jgi:hypothetical protein